MSGPYRTLTASSPAVEMDPVAPGTFIQKAFFLEGCLNIIGGVPMILIPGIILPYLTSKPTPLGENLLQLIGTLFLCLTPQLFLALPNTRFAVESRRTVYYTLGAGEGFMIPMLYWFAARNGMDGITPTAATVAIMNLLPPTLLRVYALFINPSLFGRYRDLEDGKRSR